MKPNSHTCADGKVRGTGRPTTQEAKCLTKGCQGVFGGERRKSGARGLCKKCHADAIRLIKAGETTWEEMESLGLAQPKYMTLIERCLKEARKAIKDKEQA